MNEEIKTTNALIESTMLGVEDHGILSCFLHLKYDGSGQGFGGYSLDTYNGKEREGTAWGMEFVRRILEVLEADKWEDLPGMYLRAKHTWSKVSEIGHITKDKWFNPERDLAYLTKQGKAAA